MAMQLATQRRSQARTRAPEVTVDPQEVARMAFELYEQRGRQHGYDWEDWFAAEQIVRQRDDR